MCTGTQQLTVVAPVQIEQILVSFKRVIRWRELYRLCAKCSMKPFLSCLVRCSLY